jgi:hypothetical protein
MRSLDNRIEEIKFYYFSEEDADILCNVYLVRDVVPQ